MYAFDTRIVNVFSIYNNTVLRGLTVSSPPGQPDHTPGVPCVPPHSTYLPRSMNTHSLCTQNALHSQYRHRRSKSPARATCPYYRGLRDARRVAVPKTTRGGIAAWRICRYNLDTVPDIHANKAVEAGVQTSCPFQYNHFTRVYYIYMQCTIVVNTIQ